MSRSFPLVCVTVYFISLIVLTSDAFLQGSLTPAVITFFTLKFSSYNEKQRVHFIQTSQKKMCQLYKKQYTWHTYLAHTVMGLVMEIAFKDDMSPKGTCPKSTPHV